MTAVSILARGDGWTLRRELAPATDQHVHLYLLALDDLAETVRVRKEQARALQAGASPARMLAVRRLTPQEMTR